MPRNEQYVNFASNLRNQKNFHDYLDAIKNEKSLLTNREILEDVLSILNEIQQDSTLFLLALETLEKPLSNVLIDIVGKQKVQGLLAQQDKITPCAHFINLNHPYVKEHKELQNRTSYTLSMSFHSYVNSKERSLEKLNKGDPIDRNDTKNILQENLNNYNKHTGKEIKLLDIGELHLYLTDIKTNINQKQQLIIDQDGHYTAIEILVKDGKKTCLILDAAATVAAQNIVDLIEYEKFDSVYCIEARDGQSLQRDQKSCPAFAFDHATNLSQMNDKWYDDLEKKKTENKAVYFDDLPPNLVCNAQSLKYLREYEKKHPAELDTPMPNGETYHQHIKQSTQHDPTTGKEQNRGIDTVYHSMAEVFKRSHQNTMELSPALMEEQKNSTAPQGTTDEKEFDIIGDGEAAEVKASATDAPTRKNSSIIASFKEKIRNIFPGVPTESQKQETPDTQQANRSPK